MKKGILMIGLLALGFGFFGSKMVKAQDMSCVDHPNTDYCQRLLSNISHSDHEAKLNAIRNIRSIEDDSNENTPLNFELDREALKAQGIARLINSFANKDSCEDQCEQFEQGSDRHNFCVNLCAFRDEEARITQRIITSR